MLVLGIWQSDFVMSIYTLLQIIFPYMLLQNIEYNSLCYPIVFGVNLFYVYMFMYIYVYPELLIYPSPSFPFGNHVCFVCL